MTHELECTMDQKDYINRYPDVVKSGLDPIVHYVQLGKAEGRKWIKLGTPKDKFDELKRIRQQQYLYNCRNFDSDYYLEKYPDVAKAGIDPLEHYKRYGRYEGRFSSLTHELECTMDQKDYVSRYPDVIKSGLDPVLHYVQRGEAEGRFVRRRGEQIVDDSNSHLNVCLPDTAKTIAMVVHEFSLTGCPINGWNIVKALKKKYNVIVISLDGGVLLEEFQEIADAVILVPRNLKSNIQKVTDFLEKRLGCISFYFCLCNSIETYSVLPYFAGKKVPSMLLVHEFAHYVSYEKLELGLCYATQVVYSSRTVLEATLKKLGINCKLPILPQGVSEIPGARNRLIKQYEKDLINQLSQFKQEENGRVILVVGSVNYRKGVDLFIKTAAKIKELCPEQRVKFLWIGDGFDIDNSKFSQILYAQVTGYGLDKDFIFTGNVVGIDKFYALADLLLLPSILDPLPGVVIEAITKKTPVICFEKCSGFQEYFEKLELDICIAKYLNTEDMAEKAIKILRNKKMYEDVCTKLYNFVKENFDMRTYTDRIMEMMPSVIRMNEKDVAEVNQSDSEKFLFELGTYRAKKLGLITTKSFKTGREKLTPLKPVIVGIEKNLDPKTISSEELFNATGWNVGNIAFNYAMDEILGGGIKAIPWGYPGKLENGKIGVFVTANQLGPHVDMGKVYKWMRRQDYPFIVVGLGAQSRRNSRGEFDIPEIPQGTRMWLRTVIEHAPTDFPNITLRGEFSRKVMESLGFADHAVVLGCPTLFINHDPALGQKIFKNIKEPKHIVLAAGTQQWKYIDALEASLMKMVLETNSGYVVQAEIDMIRMARGEWGKISPSNYKRLHDHFMPDLDDDSFKANAVKYGKLFGNAPDWMSYYKDFDFVVGPRIHGIMLAIQAEIPALCIAIDSRTEELCQTMKIPYIIWQDCAQGLRREDLTKIFLSQFDPDEFDKNRLVLAKKFGEFLRNNRVMAHNLPT